MPARLKTVLVGAGKIGMGNAGDPRKVRHYPYASHAQVLSRHEGFVWDAVVDPRPEARQKAREKWGIGVTAASCAELASKYEPDVAVIATHPEVRSSVVEELPGLRAVLVEKPLASGIGEAESFIDLCNRRNLLVQVNIWRRADETLRRLASGWLHELVGKPQAVFGIYGNGLRNNGTHLIDLTRMLLGEVGQARRIDGAAGFQYGPLQGDTNIPFELRSASDLLVMVQPVHFGRYREVALDIWGETGRLSITQEGLALTHYPLRPNRASTGDFEIASDEPTALPVTSGSAMYRLYTNLSEALQGNAELWSTGESALRTARVVETLMGQAAYA